MAKMIPVALVALAALAGCTPPAQQERSDLLARPIDCATAADDITALAGLVPGTGERVFNGVRLVVPAAIVAGAATGQLGTRRDIATGRTEDDVRARIAEIDAECDNVIVTYEPADPA